VRKAPSIDIEAYLRAIPLLVRHLSILIAPLLAAVLALLLNLLAQTMTDPLGGFGAGIYSYVAQIAYLTAFGVAVIQASNIWRGRDGKFDTAWEDAKRKIGGIALAAFGFLFVTYVAAYIGSALGIGVLGLILELAAAFFLIYTIPAAAIGGLPGQFAISGSIRAVRSNPAAAVVLSIVFVLLWFVLQAYGLPYIDVLVPIGAEPFVNAAAQALVLGYLAFPFAKLYDDIAFYRTW
jgi:hypothetical protein